MKKLLLLCFLFYALPITAQPFLFFGGGIGYGEYNTLNNINRTFNTQNQHSLPNFGIVPYYEFGAGNYSEHTLIEFRWTGEGAKSISKIPGSFIENATLLWRYRQVSIAFAVLPWDDKGFGIGASSNLGRLRTKYSFGGEFVETNAEYTFSSDFFVEQTLRIKLRRKRPPYIFRIRPFYQYFVVPTDLKSIEEQFNGNPDVDFRELTQRFNNFGVRFHLVVPIRQKGVIYPRDPGYRANGYGRIKLR